MKSGKLWMLLLACLLLALPGQRLVAGPKSPAPGTTMTDSKTGITLAYIPAGSFMMGSPEGWGSYFRTTHSQFHQHRQWCSRVKHLDSDFDCTPRRAPGFGAHDEDTEPYAIRVSAWLEAFDNETQHRVTLTNPFWMGTTEVTNAQYRRFVGATGHREPSYWDDSDYNRPNQPVVGVSWDDAVAYASWAGMSLPTEAQWEYAARAGTTTFYWSGDSESDLAQVGWYAGNSDLSLHAVGEKPANAWGLHDVHGNAWEWTADLYGDYANFSQTDPMSSSGHRTLPRVYRGGSSSFDAAFMRAAVRSWSRADGGYDSLGFRVVKMASVQSDAGQSTPPSVGRGAGNGESQAVQLWREDCEAGNMRGCSNLGVMYALAEAYAADQVHKAAILNQVKTDNGDLAPRPATRDSKYEDMVWIPGGSFIRGKIFYRSRGMLKAQADDPSVSKRMHRILVEAWRKLGKQSSASDVAQEIARQMVEKAAERNSYECSQAKNCNLNDAACKAECVVAATDAEIDTHLAVLLAQVDLESIGKVTLEAEVADFIVAGKSEIDEEIINVGGFFIDKHEFHYQRKAPVEGLTVEELASTEHWNNNIFREPVQNLTWSEARLECERANKRLCSELEWEKACKGPANNPFSYGTDYEGGTCLPSGFRTGDKVDTRSACANEWGVFGLSGGVREWTATGQGNNYVVKPGTIGHDSVGTRCAGRADRPGSFSQVHIGVRCCADAPIFESAAAREACDGGNMRGCSNLGVMYIRGEGVTKDESKAAELFRKACDGGNMRGCSNLGVMYIRGEGVRRDRAESRRLFRKACDGGEEMACEKL